MRRIRPEEFDPVYSFKKGWRVRWGQDNFGTMIFGNLPLQECRDLEKDYQAMKKEEDNAE